MGIKDFSKAFKAVRVVKMKDLAGKTLAIDAMTEIYRAALGAKSVHTLTDKYGQPTMHISVILANVIEMHRLKINQIWVFDHDGNAAENATFHNPNKMAELAKRRKRKTEAKEKLDVLFSDDEAEQFQTVDPTDLIKPNIGTTINIEVLLDDLPCDTNIQNAKPVVQSVKTQNPRAETKKTKDSLEKQIFTASREMINDVKLLLNMLHIRYVEAPAGFEGEAIAAYLCASGQADGVYSGDTDPIAFGAHTLYRKNPRDKKIYEYTQFDLLKQITEANDSFTDPDLDDIRTACIALGWDSTEKTPKIGAKTVLKKLHTIKLTNGQKKVREHFEQVPNVEPRINNNDKTPFTRYNRELLVDWLINERSFSRIRVTGWLDKVAK